MLIPMASQSFSRKIQYSLIIWQKTFSIAKLDFFGVLANYIGFFVAISHLDNEKISK